MKLCSYHRLMAGYATGDYVADAEQCPNAATRYACIDQQLPEHGVTHYVNLCDEHDAVVARMDGWRSSEPKVVYA